MPKVTSSVHSKDISVQYEGMTYQVTLHHHEHHRPSLIMAAIRQACGAHHPQLRLVNNSNDHVRLSWDLLKSSELYYLKRASDLTDPEHQARRHRDPQSRLAAIMQAWDLENPYDILPPSIAPRVPLPDGSKNDDEDADLLDPSLWSSRFLRALWALAAVMNQERTLGHIAQVMEKRQGS